MTARRAAGPLLVILLSSVALAVLDASGQAFWQGLAINLGLFIILTVSLNLTSGFTGVFNLGQIGFMALGAYASAILTLPLAGPFVAVATLGFLVIVRVMLCNADALTRGSRRCSNVSPYTDLWWTAGW